MDEFYLSGIHYIRLISSCPVCFEVSEIHTPKTYWMHEECHGDIYIGDNATLYCKHCGKKVSIENAIFMCPGHNSTPNDNLIRFGGVGRRVINKESIIESLNLSSISEGWMFRFAKSLIHNAYNGFNQHC